MLPFFRSMSLSVKLHTSEALRPWRYATKTIAHVRALDAFAAFSSDRTSRGSSETAAVRFMLTPFKSGKCNVRNEIPDPAVAAFVGQLRPRMFRNATK